ncbi:hypothetical protein [Nocardioides stalactiti]|uniref:hypothetical protein n=1 Tax=Nocardioides stalactiti TaxID=2755356 RepID=UPI0016043FBE|nr:hypothetical protein [Nocardioides stalactiti]
MTGEQLRDELARIAEGAPEVHVPDDLYRRGRRATTRARVAVAAAAVACLGLIAGVAVPLVAHHDVEFADSDELAVPDRIYAPPSHMTDLEDDLEVGVAAGAFVTDALIPVVVEADSGTYHLLDLEGFTQGGFFRTRLGFALSPDGEQLAWAYADDVESGHRPSGIRVADLSTGRVREIRVDQDRAVLIHDLAWSTQGGWLAWLGVEMEQWDTDGVSSGKRTVGGIVREGQSSATYQVVAGRNANRVFEQDGGQTIDGGATSAVAVSDTGKLAAVVGWSFFLNGVRGRLEQDPSLRIGGLWFLGEKPFGLTYSADGSDVPAVRVMPDGRSSPIRSTLDQPDLLGALGPRQVLVGPGDDGDDPSGVQLWTWNAPGGGHATGTFIRLYDGVLGLTLASDLIDPVQPQVVARPRPDWPWSTDRWWWTIGGGAASTAAIGLIVLIVVRARAVRG